MFRWYPSPSPATSAAVGPFVTTFLSGASRSVSGLPSITSTVVGWYCSCEVSQMSVCARSMVIGEYVSTSFWAGPPEASAPGASHRAEQATSIARHQRNRRPADPRLITDPYITVSSLDAPRPTLTQGRDGEGSAPDRLADAEQVALAVAKPGGTLPGAALAGVIALDLRDAVGRGQPRNVVLLEDDAAVPELAHRRLDVVDLPPHLRVLARRCARRLKDRELTAAAAIAKAARPHLDRLQAQLLRVEAPGPVEVLRGQPGRDRAAGQSARAGRSTLHPLRHRRHSASAGL